MENRNAGKTFVDYFAEYGCQNIAIFDAGEIGRLLYEEIKNSNVKVLYFIDRNAEGMNNVDGIPVVMINEIGNMPEVDIVVVSTIFNYEEVLRLLLGINPEITSISMKDAVYEF
jgi:glutamyl-tRNA reductase